MSDEKQKGPGMTLTPNPASERRAAYVEALKLEREGYVVRGLEDRVAAVDAELARFGAAPKGRSASKRQTT